jgi:hypothetical protein
LEDRGGRYRASEEHCEDHRDRDRRERALSMKHRRHERPRFAQRLAIHGEGDGLGAAAGPEACERIREMPVDGALGDTEYRRYLLARAATRYEIEDLRLPRTE